MFSSCGTFFEQKSVFAEYRKRSTNTITALAQTLIPAPTRRRAMYTAVRTHRPWKIYTATFTHPERADSYSVGGIMEGSYDQFQQRRTLSATDWQTFTATFLDMEITPGLKSYIGAVSALPGGTNEVVIQWSLDGETQMFTSAPVYLSEDDSDAHSSDEDT